MTYSDRVDFVLAARAVARAAAAQAAAARESAIAMLVNLPAGKMLGRTTAGSGAIEAIDIPTGSSGEKLTSSIFFG